MLNLLLTGWIDGLDWDVVGGVADDKWKSGVVFLAAEVFTGTVKRDGGVDEGRDEEEPAVVSQDIVKDSNSTYIPRSSIAKLPFAMTHPDDTS